MKKIVINIILVFCSVLSYAQHQDTIEFGEGGYWLPNNDYRVFGCRTSMPVNFCGNIYKPDSNVRILGLSCFADSLKRQWSYFGSCKICWPGFSALG